MQVKRTPMILYNERKSSNCCVRCGTPHIDNWTLKKCQTCRTNESNYRKKTRNARRKSQERSYQIKNWFNRCLYLSKQADKRKNRTSDEEYITPERLCTLRVLQENKCFYCDTELQVENRKQSNGLTIERLDNAKPHTMNNVILCCSSCNCRRVSNKINKSAFEIFHQIYTKFEQRPEFKAFMAQLSDLHNGSP